jgi:hypothetical protein
MRDEPGDPLEDAPFGEPMNLASPPNSDQDEGVPWILSDNTTILYVAVRPENYWGGDIWQIEIQSDEGPSFRRADSNIDGAVNIADATYILQHLFASGSPIQCSDAADANDDGGVNMADAIYILQNLFASGAAIPPPSPDCNVDPTGDELSCGAYAHCE